MSIRAYRDIHRRKSRQIMVSKVPVGGDAPITVQTMTNTITGDARATIDQIRGIEDEAAHLAHVRAIDDPAARRDPLLDSRPEDVIRRLRPVRPVNQCVELDEGDAEPPR